MVTVKVGRTPSNTFNIPTAKCDLDLEPSWL